MKPARHFIIDDIAKVLRKPRASPLLEPREVISCALNYAMQYEFWKRQITDTSLVVRAVEEALRSEGYKIVPMERADYESRK
jgi:hypothetical protein